MRHTAEQIDDSLPGLPALGVPEPQMVLQLMVVLKPVDSAVPEQIIAVPKFPSPSRPLRAALAATQMAEQLVEVPTDVVVLMETDAEDEEEDEEGGQPGRAAGPQERVPQRTVEPMLETFVPVPSLDVPVLQMVDQLVAMIKLVDPVVPEQIYRSAQDLLAIPLPSYGSP